jgi:hypothetical protein
MLRGGCAGRHCCPLAAAAAGVICAGVSWCCVLATLHLLLLLSCQFAGQPLQVRDHRLAAVLAAVLAGCTRH